jgi:type IV pilus assembly protein PilN
MPHINLLPWREELRKRRQKEFGMVALVAMLLMGGVVGGVHVYFQQRIDHQERRNKFLNQQIASLDEKIEEIKNLEREKERLLARMDIIQRLQSSRPEIVNVLDDLVRTLPEGVFYTNITQKNRSFQLKGTAQSNARVSSLMRALDDSAWFENPNLVEIKANNKDISASTTVKLSDFSLTVTQSEKKKPDEEQGGAGS